MTRKTAVQSSQPSQVTDPEVTTLDNGLRVVSQTMGHLETVSLGVWIASGARHESPSEHGLTHFLEHMAFKGTPTRTAREIAEEIESAGGELNAATSIDTTAYFARTLKDDALMALDLLSDILLDAVFPDAEIAREREVVLHEIAAIADSPDDIAYDLLHEAAYPGQPLGRTIIGTVETVSGFSASDLRALRDTSHRPPRMVIAAAGAIQHDTLVRHVAARFGGLISGDARHDYPAAYAGGLRTSKKLFEQSHLLVGFEAPSFIHGSYYAAQVFSGLFGGGMSSRLFQEVRERRGLCYSIYASAWGLRDTGMLTIHAATARKHMPELVDVISDEFTKATESQPFESELARAKAQIKAGLVMALESSGARAEQMARQLIGLGRLVTPEELVAKVDGVTAEDVRGVARDMLRSAPSIVIVGAGRRAEEYARRAETSIRV